MEHYTNNDYRKVEDTLWTNNKDNLSDYSIKSQPNFRNQKDSDRLITNMKNTDWNNETKYYTSGDTILKMNNKEWHKLTKYKYAR